MRQLHLKRDQSSKIRKCFSNFSRTNSFAIPDGKPAARILSELVLNQLDRLLSLEGIQFCRFADDYHLFCDNYKQAFRSLVFLWQRLPLNEGSQLHKANTKIAPENGPCRSWLLHQRRQALGALPKIDGFVVTRTFTAAGAAIMWRPSRRAAPREAMPG